MRSDPQRSETRKPGDPVDRFGMHALECCIVTWPERRGGSARKALLRVAKAQVVDDVGRSSDDSQCRRRGNSFGRACR
jgi:hypothetical protein